MKKNIDYSQMVHKNSPHDPKSLEAFKWWGEFHFPLNQIRTWQFGSLLFRLIRHKNEWRSEYYRPSIQHEDQQDWKILDNAMAFPQPSTFARYMFNQTSDTFYLMPRLADRGVVIKPTRPMYIPAGQQSTLFISTPLWFCGTTAHSRTPLFDLPIILPKDTWFGADNLSGEMCYATPVDGRTELSLLRPRAFRAVTPIHFYNASHQQMRLKRINVPVPSLPLFHSLETGRLWTSEISVFQDSIGRPPRIRIESRTPKLAGAVRFVQAARVETTGLITNMFDGLF